MGASWEELIRSVAAGAFLVPIVQGILGMLKPLLKRWGLPSEYIPGIAFSVGILLSLFMNTYILGVWWAVSVIVGAVAGLASSALYDYQPKGTPDSGVNIERSTTTNVVARQEVTNEAPAQDTSTR